VSSLLFSLFRSLLPTFGLAAFLFAVHHHLTLPKPLSILRAVIYSANPHSIAAIRCILAAMYTHSTTSEVVFRNEPIITFFHANMLFSPHPHTLSHSLSLHHMFRSQRVKRGDREEAIRTFLESTIIWAHPVSPSLIASN